MLPYSDLQPVYLLNLRGLVHLQMEAADRTALLRTLHSVQFLFLLHGVPQASGGDQLVNKSFWLVIAR